MYVPGKGTYTKDVIFSQIIGEFKVDSSHVVISKEKKPLIKNGDIVIGVIDMVRKQNGNCYYKQCAWI